MKKEFKDLDLKNSFLFASALQEPDICQLVLEIIFGTKLPKVKVHTEHTILFSSDFRSVRLDVYASSETEVYYNVESQNNRTRNLPKRSRFHQAEMDVISLKPGEDFNELKPSYVIFICTFDPFGKGRYQYTFEERCLEEDFPLGDGTKKIFLNSKGKNDEETPPLLVHFLKYIENSTEQCVETIQEEAIEKLHGKILALKKSRDLEVQYMTLADWLDDESEKELEEKLEKRVAEELEKRVAEDRENIRAEEQAESRKIIYESIFELLSLKGEIPSACKEKISTEKDGNVLKKWLLLAIKVTSLEEFTEKM